MQRPVIYLYNTDGFYSREIAISINKPEITININNTRPLVYPSWFPLRILESPSHHWPLGHHRGLWSDEKEINTSVSGNLRVPEEESQNKANLLISFLKLLILAKRSGSKIKISTRDSSD